MLPKSNESQHHAHVTLITAVDSDSLQVPETILDNQYHGALSWFFAQALTGKADGNQNGHLERDELAQFLNEKVSHHMNNQQKPKLLPRSDNVSVFHLDRLSQPPVSNAPDSNIAIIVQNGKAPQGLSHTRRVSSSQANVTRFDSQYVGKESKIYLGCPRAIA